MGQTEQIGNQSKHRYCVSLGKYHIAGKMAGIRIWWTKYIIPPKLITIKYIAKKTRFAKLNLIRQL